MAPESGLLSDPIWVRRRNRHSLVELRAVGGVGAGRIWSLGMGTHTLGPAPDSAVVLGGAPGPDVRLTVTAGGEAWLAGSPTLHTIRPTNSTGTAWAALDDPSGAGEFRWPEGAELSLQGTRLSLVRTQPAATKAEPVTDLAKAERDLLLERVVRCAEVPDPAALAADAVGRKSALWRRRPGQKGRLWLRVGSAEGLSHAKHALADQSAEHWTLPGLPCGVDLAETGVLGVRGAPDVARALARWLLVQAATHCAPAELGIRVIADPSAGRSWDWVGRLPHLDASAASEAYAAADPLRVGRSIGELAAEIAARVASGRTDKDRGKDILAVFDRASMLREVDGVAEILDKGPELGVYAICLDAADAIVPECRAEVRCSARDLALTARRHREQERGGITPDLVTVEWCERVADAVAAHGSAS